MIYQFFALVLIISVVYAIAYRRGKNSVMKEEPSLAKKENKEYLKFKLFDELMTNDDFFSDDIVESSTTDSNKDKLK